MRIRESLVRQSILVAVVTAAVDAAVLSTSGAPSAVPIEFSIVLLGVVGADLALAAPPRTVGLVAAAQAILRLVEALIVYRHGWNGEFADIGFLVAGYRVGAWMVGPKSVAAVAALCTGFAGAHLMLNSGMSHDGRILTATISFAVVPFLVGRHAATLSTSIAAMKQQAALREQEQVNSLARVVAEERAVIARDLHDVISHHVSAIGIHAGVARMAMSKFDAGTAAATSLSAVESSSRAAMADLRRQLDILHGREPDTVQQPGAVAIDDLLREVRTAGLAVKVNFAGNVKQLPDSLNLTLYRVVQELLTNALRHGRRASPAMLSITYGTATIVIELMNPMVTQLGNVEIVREGRGLSGMRKRVELFGGTLQYGSDENGTYWRATAVIPI